MKALILSIVAIIIFVGNIQTAPKTQGTVKVALGKRASVDRGRIKVKFLSVVEDSRCPVNATCIWAGNARIRIAVTKGKAPSTFLELNTLTEPKTATLYGYEFVVKDLLPRKGEGASRTATTAVLSIVRKRSGY